MPGQLLLESGFLHVGQVGLKLSTSADPPASASESAGITGMSHQAQSDYFNYSVCLLLKCLAFLKNWDLKVVGPDKEFCLHEIFMLLSFYQVGLL